MTSVARGRGAQHASPAPPRLPPLPGVSPPLPVAVEEQWRRALGAVLDVARIGLSVLVLRVAQCLTLHPRQCTLAALEGELRDTLLALGATLLTELVRLRGTGDLGAAYTCACGVHLERKELASLQQRTWFGVITLERAIYAGAGCHVRAPHVPLDAAWGLLGAAESPDAAGLPDPDGGVLMPAAPGTGPARLAPAFAAVVVEFGARLPYGEAAHLPEVAFGAVVRLAPNSIRALTRLHPCRWAGTRAAGTGGGGAGHPRPPADPRTDTGGASSARGPAPTDGAGGARH